MFVAFFDLQVLCVGLVKSVSNLRLHSEAIQRPFSGHSATSVHCIIVKQFKKDGFA